MDLKSISKWKPQPEPQPQPEPVDHHQQQSETAAEAHLRRHFEKFGVEAKIHGHSVPFADVERRRPSVASLREFAGKFKLQTPVPREVREMYPQANGDRDGHGGERKGKGGGGKRGAAKGGRHVQNVGVGVADLREMIRLPTATATATAPPMLEEREPGREREVDGDGDDEETRGVGGGPAEEEGDLGLGLGLSGVALVARRKARAREGARWEEDCKRMSCGT